MEGSSEEALIPKKRSSLGVPLVVIALLVVFGVIFRAARKRRAKDAASFDDALPPAEVPPSEPPVLLQTAEGKDEIGAHHEPEPSQAEPVSANGSYGETPEHG